MLRDTRVSEGEEEADLLSEIDPIVTLRQQDMSWYREIAAISGFKDVVELIVNEEIVKNFAYPGHMPFGTVGKRKRLDETSGSN